LYSLYTATVLTHYFTRTKQCYCDVMWVCPGFLGAFAKLRKATISCVVSVRPSIHPSVCVEQLDSH